MTTTSVPSRPPTAGRLGPVLAAAAVALAFTGLAVHATTPAADRAQAVVEAGEAGAQAAL